MTSPVGNGAAGYRLIYPEVVRQEIARLRAGLPDAAARGRFDAAMRNIEDRMRNDPLGFGEYRYRLAHMQLAVHVGSVMPVTVRYAVHEVRPLVFVLEVVLLSGPGV
jgi:hypothetical protein